MQYGLSRIILIDSYLPGRLYEIDINGHTNIMGENLSYISDFIESQNGVKRSPQG
jgi:hypothetical protein